MRPGRPLGGSASLTADVGIISLDVCVTAFPAASFHTQPDNTSGPVRQSLALAPKLCKRDRLKNADDGLPFPTTTEKKMMIKKREIERERERE